MKLLRQKRKTFVVPTAPPMTGEITHGLEIRGLRTEQGDSVAQGCAVTDDSSEYPVVIDDYREDVGDLSARRNIIEFTSWSASVKPPYQRARIAAIASSLSIRVFAPNSKGQGEGSPSLGVEDIEELRGGRAHRLGGFAVQMAFQSLRTDEQKPTDITVLGVSQGPLLVPGGMAELREQGVGVKDVILVTPASTWEGSILGLGASMLLNGAKKMGRYRKENPANMQGLKDTKISTWMRNQKKAHLIDYPIAMQKQDLAAQIIEEANKMDEKPRFHVVSAEKDKASRLKRNEELVKKLRDAGLVVSHLILEGQYHAVSEHTPLMSRIIDDVLNDRDIEAAA